MKPQGAEDKTLSTRRILLKDKAYAMLKEKILNDLYPPGAALAERRLAEDLGMSKTPIKAALERLELEGYITIAPQRFVRVREIEDGDIADEYEMRTALESYIVRRLAAHRSADMEQRLQEHLLRQRELIGSSQVAPRVEMDAGFHMLLAEVLGNRAMMRLMAELQDRFHRVICRVFQRLPERYSESVEEHARIVQAIISGDGDRAVTLVVDHLKRGRHTTMI